jgi:hypothetical protein
MKIKKWVIPTIIMAVCGSVSSCYEDKGNYDYDEIEQIEITFPDNVTALANTEYLNFCPTVVSSLYGEIKPDNDNYEYSCKIFYYHEDENGDDQKWLEIDEEKTQEVNFFASIPADTYKVWYAVTNKNTGVTTNVQGSLKVISTTTEGWMVLSNHGTDKKVQLDMIFEDSNGKDRVAYDVMGSDVPNIHHGTQIYMNPSRYANMEMAYLLSYSGGYRLDEATLKTSESQNLKAWDFIAAIDDEPISMLYVSYYGSYGPLSRFCVTSNGDAYAIYSSLAGSSFEHPMNTDAVGNATTFKISPKVGTSMMRPGNSSCVLVYDVTNKKFMYWNYYATSPNNKLLLNLTEPSDKLFSYTTGKTLVDMESTKFSNGLVYSVLEDDQHKRSVYGINLANNALKQECYYDDIKAEHFDDATDYAFHSQFPFMFYCLGNKVYSYNLGTKSLKQVLSLPEGETTSRVKFNLFSQMNLTLLNNQSEDFLNMQYHLIVMSSTGKTDGGIVRFYKVENDGTLTKVKEFTGFGDEVVDVTYRERR